MWEILVAGFVFGSVASLHCVAMCGPIALMLPHPSTKPASIVADNIAYNLGRAATYSLFGLVAGFFGSIMGLGSLQSGASIAIGIAILVGYFFYKLLPATKLPFASTARTFASVIKKPFAELLTRKSRGSLFGLGLLNGLLPCGMVYAALAFASVMQSPSESVIFMASYGLGTFPAMTALYLLPKSFTGRFKGWAAKAVPIFVVLAASLLILRGLELDLGMLSPEIPVAAVGESEICGN